MNGKYLYLGLVIALLSACGPSDKDVANSMVE